MFMLVGLIGAVLGHLYATYICPIIFEYKNTDSTNNSDGQVWFIVLPGAFGSMILVEEFLVYIWGPSFESYTGLWEFFDLLPSLLSIPLILILTLFSIFFLIFYLVMPVFFIVGYIMQKLAILTKKE